MKKRLISMAIACLLVLSMVPFAFLATDTAAEAADAVASATPKESSVPAVIHNNLSAEGFWIHSVLSDVTLSETLRVDGNFHGKTGDANDPLYRKLALYAQDSARKVTAEYTLTTPAMVVTTPNFRVQQGTIKGDVYVSADGFELYNSTVDGNLVFTDATYQASAKLDTGKVTGEISVGSADTMAGATPRESVDPTNIKYALSENGYWILSLLSDVAIDGDLSVDGNFYGKTGDPNEKAYRKLALYAQDSSRNVTAEYTLSVSKLIVNTPGFRVQNGTVKGNVHVNANGFELYDSTIEGNLIFNTQAQKDSALLDRGTVTGNISVLTADVLSSATPRESSEPANIHYSMSADGYWIHSLLSDVVLDEILIVNGEFYGSTGAGALYRKLALYAQDSSRKVTAEYTLTTPRMVVKSSNFRVQQGTVKGEVFVDAPGFELYNSTIDGNLIFSCDAYLDSAKLERGTVTGDISVGEVADAVSGATMKESVNAANLVYNMSDIGNWIFSAKADMNIVDALHVDGTFYGSSGDQNGKTYRKLALYAQDSSRKVTAEYTLTVPEMFVTSPGFRIQNGTVKGNVHVNAFGFEMYDCTIDGNLTFETEAQMNSALLDRGTVTGTIEVGYADTYVSDVDAASGATVREGTNAYRTAKSLSAEGYWIYSLLSDIVMHKPLYVDGTFYGKSGDITGKPDRKLALYAQDDKRNVTAEYTLTVPQMYVSTPNFRVVNGTVKGNVFVSARGFKLEGTASINGNLVFETQELMDSATFDASMVTGNISVQD